MDRRRLILGLVTVLVLVYSIEASALIVQDLVDQVSQDNYSYYLDDLLYTHTGDNRGFGSEHDLARANIFNEFDSFGLQTNLDPFQYSSSTYYNIVGVHPGRVRPDDIYILGAHYDSANNPGADDNASGTAGVMEAARILSQYDFEATLIFIAFDREEQGLRGSAAYAWQHRNDNILGMVSMDMIAYNGSGNNRANIYSDLNSDPLAQDLADAVSLYGNGLTPVDAGDTGRSDHAPFQDEGFQAVLFIENDSSDNPYYHTQSDTVDTPGYIDYAFATNMVRSTTGYAATAAVLIPEPTALLIMSAGVLFLRRKSRPPRC
jgi:Zn-dependent M28 family amino/carboxypeptidase